LGYEPGVLGGSSGAEIGEDADGGGGGPPSPPTTCFSPVFSAKNSSAGGGFFPGVDSGSKDKYSHNETGFAFFAPYSTVLSVTIAIGKGGVCRL